MAHRFIANAQWMLPPALLSGLSALVVWRKLPGRLPIFSAYVFINTAHAVSWLVVSQRFGFRSLASYYFYWITEGIVLSLRGLAIAELSYHFLRQYRGIWNLAWRILVAVSVLLVLYAGVSASGQAHWLGGFVLTLDRGLELAAAVALLALLSIAGYYKLDVPGPEKLIAFGFAFYSVSVVAYDTLVLRWVKSAESSSLIQEICYLLVMATWIVALSRPLPAPKAAPQLLRREVYAELVPQVNYRLELLNNRLLEILRS